ncbi:UDP-N-acetylglucosamine 1-carboxyvinyltransferase [Priestia megaterium]|uniref:UDP-N-acetylglucosamine 1-carboxyvinyltransferase n=1 Tax=Priestia megaterium TaxID=1404 RepID=A0A6M6E1P3_PRIMG|nr:UDP-N-acetylglucosamine 1-carboxyvinyltransferase [Priestia megaterium]QJX80700.1 UDP-N-acetylglucosamine 1-carboxyvinyltransferase [Priestia megaterium]
MSVLTKTKETVIISGQTPLFGTVTTQGSKNSALPLLAALPLLPEVELTNVPDLTDIHVMVDVLKYLGATGTFSEGVVKLDLRNLMNRPISADFTDQLRASSLFMGSLLGKFGEGRVGMPGGCVIGSRPLDIHLNGFESLGAEVDSTGGNISVISNGLEGHFTLPLPSVGATQNLICASVFSPGEVKLHNIAIEPEIFELVEFLNGAGANITFENPKTLTIRGVKRLNPVQFNVQPDRIEAFTLLVAGVATKGSVKVTHCRPEHLTAPLQALEAMGAKVEVGENWVEASYVGPLKGIEVETGFYPAFPTDCQQQISILMALAETPSILSEKVFNSRFRHLDELRNMGAQVKITNDNSAIIQRSKNEKGMIGCTVDSYDLRGAASMIIAGMVSEGVTTVKTLRYLYRGYEEFIEKLNRLGAEISYR